MVKGLTGRKKITIDRSDKEISSKKICSHCGETRNLSKDYYSSDNPLDSDGRIKMCKFCIKEYINYNDIETIKNILHQINKPFIQIKWDSATESSKNTKAINRDPFGIYMKILYLNYNGQGLTWKDSDEKTLIKEVTIEKQIINTHENEENSFLKNEYSDSDLKNKDDVLKMIGYDPFYSEPEIDKKNLYNKLVDFLDESTLEDNFKLPAVIEIVKSYSQIDKINSTISNILADVDKFASNVGGITSLVNAKEKMLKSILALAKDNGISVNHNNNKSKGSGTLSGIIKQLSEKGIESSEINIYDIETCEGMKQVADISNRSILEQLMLNENDYTEMIKDQKELIDVLRNKNNELEEENRKVKIALKSYEQ
ncbi:hypothetical protein JCM16418A_14160 [Paenibacillus pini]|uniref:Uncharacterized protein n=2 Tax=Paenibacillus TaxID=44249 RepID=W7Z8R9_9BACL|nr:hypothetical protein JCM16418_5074 [Paenibacillus pini JCM 16418]